MAKAFNPDILYSFIDILAKTQQEMRFSNHAKVYIESALLKMIHLDARPVQVTDEQASDSGLGQKVAELERTIADVTTANCQRSRDASD